MTTNKAFQVWLYSKENYERGLQLADKVSSDEIIPTLLKFWKRLDKGEKRIWTKKTEKLNNYWIKENTLKRCKNHYNWNDSTIIVAKCKQDNRWYMSDDNYSKGTGIEGEWPTNEGVELQPFSVGIKLRWTDDGLKLSFKKL